jgi:hypothetical protein
MWKITKVTHTACVGVKEDFMWSLGRKKRREDIMYSTYTEGGGDNIKIYFECGKGVICINPAQVRDKWRAVVNTVMNFSIL